MVEETPNSHMEHEAGPCKVCKVWGARDVWCGTGPLQVGGRVRLENGVVVGGAVTHFAAAQPKYLNKDLKKGTEDITAANSHIVSTVNQTEGQQSTSNQTTRPTPTTTTRTSTVNCCTTTHSTINHSPTNQPTCNSTVPTPCGQPPMFTKTEHSGDDNAIGGTSEPFWKTWIFGFCAWVQTRCGGFSKITRRNRGERYILLRSVGDV
jgi:hypothetical protein